MTRIASAAFVLAACGSHGPPDAAPAAKVIDAGVAVTIAGAVGPPPAVAIWLPGRELAVAPTGGTWDAIAARRVFVHATHVASPGELARAVLGVEVAGGGAGAARAKQWISAFDDAPAADAGADDGISMTYLAPITDLKDPTPLIVAAPRGDAALLVATLDAVGGEIAIDDGTSLRVLDVGAPWGNPGYGGLDLAEDRPSVDITVGIGKLLVGGDLGPGHVIAPDAAALAPYLRGTETATIDLLITPGTSVADVLAAIAAAPGRTIGVGLTADRFPALGMDGQPALGSIGVGHALPIGTVVTADHDYAAIAKRSLVRAVDRLLACGGHGTEKISFDVDAAGKISKPHTTKCVADVLTSLALPPPPGGHATISTTLELP